MYLTKLTEHDIILLIEALRDAKMWNEEMIDLDKELGFPVDYSRYEKLARYQELRQTLEKVLQDEL